MIYDNKSGVSAFLSAPAELNTKKIYPIDNYGSSMAPFYSTLSIWIGGIVLVAMLKVTVSEESIKKMGLKNVRIHEIYLGRWIIFLILGLLQSTLIALGDLYYLGIQCAHTFLFLFGCWFSSIVYVTISYTLTVSFGDIGKAGSVVFYLLCRLRELVELSRLNVLRNFSGLCIRFCHLRTVWQPCGNRLEAVMGTITG